MAKMLSTLSVPRKKKLDFWNEAVSQSFVSLDCSARGGRDFIEGDIRLQPLSALEVSRVRGTGQRVMRVASGISGSGVEDCYLVGIQTRGSCIVTQDGRAAIIEHGDFALYDTQRPYSLDLSDDFEQIVVRLPHGILDRHIPSAQRLTAVPVRADQGAGALLVGAIRSFAEDVVSLTPEVSYSVAQGLEFLIVAGFEGAMPARPGTGRAETRALVERHIKANLRDSTLSITSISTALHLSPSSVHRSFAADGQTVMSWVWERRLEGAYRDLVEGLNRGTLTDLALSWGFSDSAHFSRAFRRQHGRAPSQVRAAVSDRP